MSVAPFQYCKITFRICRYHLLLPLSLLLFLTTQSKAQDFPNILGLLSGQRTSIKDSARIISIINKGVTYARNSSDSATYFFEQARDESIAKGFTLGLVRSLHSLGTFYLEKGQISEAKDFYTNSLRWCSAIDPSCQAERSVVCNNLGSVYLYTGVYDSASRLFYYAAYLGERYKASKEIMLSIYNNLSSIMDKLQEKEQSLLYLTKAIKIAEGTKNPYLLNALLYNKAMAFKIGHKNDSAVTYYNRSLEQSRKSGFTKIELATLLSLAGCYSQQEEQQKYLQQAVQLVEKGNINYSQQEMATLYELSKAYYSLGAYRKAEIQAQFLEQKAAQSRSTEMLVNARELQADIYGATRKYEQAFAAQKDFSRLKDSLLNKDKIEAISLLETKYHTVQKDKQIAENKLRITNQENELRKKNMLILSIMGITLLLTALFVFIYRFYKHKQKAHIRQLLLLQQEQEIKQLKAMMEGEDKERGRLARDLHDGIGGMLASIRMNLGAAKDESPSPENTKRINDIILMVQDTSAEVRKTAHNLMPEVLLKHSLAEALVLYCESVSTGRQVKIEVQLHGNLQRLDKATELMLYRIAQELVQNIIKYARADYAVIQKVEKEDKLSMFIEDNGIGFDVHQTGGGYGLQNLRYRVQALQGTVSIMSEPGRGTTIHIEFDLNTKKETDS